MCASVWGTQKAVSLSSSIVVGSQCIISKMQKCQQNSSVNILFRIIKVNNRRDKKVHKMVASVDPYLFPLSLPGSTFQAPGFK